MAPTEAKAGLFSSLFGEVASASGEELVSGSAPEAKPNSQTLGLLEVRSTPPAAPKAEKKDDPKKDEPGTDGEVNKDADVYISGNALVASTTPLFGTGGPDMYESYGDLSVYAVKSGDTLAKIADLFGVTGDTILSFNNMKKGDKLVPDMILIIPGYSGVEYKVEKGDSLTSIAKKFKVDMDDVILSNHLEGTKIVVGDTLFIPGGELLAESKPKSTPKSSSNIAKSSGVSGGAQIYVDSGYFINPLPSGHFVRGLSRSHKGVDIGAPTGTPIMAVASGRILAAKSGWNGGYGNMVIEQNDNGTTTLYAHMSRLGTSTGATVARGEVIGYVGSTGHSTGPHLHIEIKGTANPFDR